MRRVFVLLAGLSALLATTTASAQVNVETLRGTLRPYEAQAGLEWSFTGRAGNTQGMDGGGAGKFLYSLGRHNFFGFGSLDYTRLNKQLQVSRRWAHLRYEYLFSAVVSGEVFAQTQSDAIRRLSLRQLVGVGPRVRVVDDAGKTAAVGVGPMFELERVRVAPGATDEPRETNHRVNAYASVLWKIDERVAWNAVAYFQPRWDAPKDFRILFDGGLIFAISKRLSAKLLVGLRHDNRPPTGVLPTDAELKNALALTL